jgi:hypothetical protein
MERIRWCQNCAHWTEMCSGSNKGCCDRRQVGERDHYRLADEWCAEWEEVDFIGRCFENGMGSCG